jgi:hypothetical protein
MSASRICAQVAAVPHGGKTGVKPQPFTITNGCRQGEIKPLFMVFD